MSNIKVSVIVPVFNVESYLNESLDSILNQTLKDIEIICINDGSTDNSLDILENYAKKDKRIKIISKENEGQGVARNVGLDNAQGEYISFVDSDDFIKKDMLEKLYNKAENNNLDLVMCKVSSFDNETHEVDDDLWYYSLKCFDGFKKDVFNNLDTKKFTDSISVTPYNKLYKRSFIETNNIRFPNKYIFEDEVFFYNVYLKAKRISLVDENLYYYRTNRKGSTVSKSSDNDYIDVIYIFRLIRDLLVETGYVDVYKEKVYNRFIHLTLWRFSQTAPKYRQNFFNLMKKDFEEILSDKLLSGVRLNINKLEPRVKSRTLKVLKAANLEEFNELDSYKIFSVVMALYNNEDYLAEAIESLTVQNFGFEHNVELIIVDDGSTDNSLKIAKEFEASYPDNIKVIHKENGGQASARNLGLKYVKGDYVNFLDSDDKLSPSTLKAVYEFILENPDVEMISIPITFFDNQQGPHLLNYKYKKDKVVDLIKDPQYPQLSASSAFIKKETIDGLAFDSRLVNSEDALLLNKILINNPQLGLVKDANYLYRKRFDESSTIDNSQKKKGFFTDRLKYYFEELINYSNEVAGETLKFIQYTLVYDLQWMVKAPDINGVFNEAEKKEFWKTFLNVLSHIDVDVIKTHKTLNIDVRDFLLAIKKYNFTPETISNLKIDDKIATHRCYIDIIKIKNDILYISGLLMSYYNPDTIEIVAICGDEKFVASRFVYPTRENLKFLSIEYKFPYDFDLEIPLANLKDNKVEIMVLHDGKYYKLPIAFENHARLSASSNYFIKDSKMVLFKDNSFYLNSYSFIRMLMYEVRCLLKIFKDRGPFFTSALFFRVIYLVLYPFLKNRKIWLFMDRREAADDNAEYLFRYASAKDDKISKYFTVSLESKDFNRLKDFKNILPFYSFKQRFVYLFADKIISSHPDENILNPFHGKNGELYSGLITSEKYFLQHGVTKDNISRWLRKYDKDLSLILTVSDLERESFLDPSYNYAPEIIQTLGFPRFDNLESKNLKKQILIMPSWRENIQKSVHGLKKSKYFIELNKLLKNEDLISFAKEKGYEIIFKPHPNLFKFIDIFDLSEDIIVDDKKTYQELFNESMLLITDYSSVAFDFAYLKKPVIYYQYSDDYNFDLSKSYFKYNDMGFGEVVSEEKQLIDLIKRYLDNDCIMKDVYKSRVDAFYKFRDKENCMRVYNFLIND